jgi:hypothetical protein
MALFKAKWDSGTLPNNGVRRDLMLSGGTHLFLGERDVEKWSGYNQRSRYMFAISAAYSPNVPNWIWGARTDSCGAQ